MKTCKGLTLLGLPIAAAALTLGTPVQGQVIFDQSTPLITQPGGGCPSNPGPKNDSELQNQPGPCANILGQGAGNAAGVQVAEDFTVTSNVTVTGFRFYAYQTGAPAGPPPTSTMNGAFVQVWNGPPGAGGTVIAGSPATNIFTSSAWSQIYRSTETGANMDLCNRAIMAINATLTAPLNLTPGTYWVSWGLTGTVASGPFVPPLTVEGAPPTPGNARQTTNNGGTWAQLFDTGIAGCAGQPPAPGYTQALPFQVLGSGGDPCASPLPPCRSDIVGPGNGPPDGTTNVNDLLAVINSWGQSGPQPPNGTRPLGDVDPLPNGNCFVNVNDLLVVINGWGPCPVPTGACCLTNGTCLTNVTQANCTGQGGVYQGNNSACPPAGCPVAPPGDECATATAISNGATNIDNTNATTSTGVPGAACIFGGPQNFQKDLWFNYTATCTGNVTVDTCATTGAVTDTVLQVLTGPCTSLTEVACDDDACTGNPAGDRSRVTFAATSGTVYRIRVGTWGANPGGPMVLTINCAVLNNDNCSDATALTLGTPVNDSLLTATQDSAPACQGVGVAKGRWYTVMGTGNTFTANTCGSPNPPPGQEWDGRLSVYCGADCNSLFCVAAANADSCGIFQESVSWCAAAGTKYWILVHTDDALGAGQYTLVVNSGATCNNPVLCGTPGDECATAFGPLVVGANNLNNSGMTTSTQAPCNTITLDAWYNFTPASSGLHQFSLCGGGAIDSVLAIYSGDCSGLTQVACDDDGCGQVAGMSIFSANLTAGTPYKVRYGSWNNSATGPGTLTISLSAGCGACVGNPEGAPCRVDGDDPLTDPNGGCNSTSLPPGTAFGGPVGALPWTVCGIGSYYTTNAAGYRDTDWYLFTPATSGSYSIEACPDFPATIGFVQNSAGNITSCGAGLAFVAGAANIPAFTVSTATSTLVGGNTYAVFVAPQTGLGTLACNNYRATVMNAAPPPPGPPNDDCGAPVVIGSGNVGPIPINTAGATSNAANGNTCDKLGDSPTIFNDLWFRWTATTTGTATFSMCGSAYDNKMALYPATACPSSQGAIIACNDEGCSPSATFIANVTAGQSYLIRLGSWQEGVTGTGNLTVSGQ